MAKVKSITVSNVKAVSNMSANFNGCTAIVTGGNNKGKSSFLKSHIERIRGTIKADGILRNGEKEGFAELELTTGEKFTWTFNDKGKEKLTYISERNIPGSVTRDLAKVYFPTVFDVDEFLNSTPKKQKETLQKITGIDFSEIDQLYKDAYDNRTFYNKQYESEKAKAAYIDPKLPTEITDTSELEKKIGSVELHNLKYSQAKDKVQGYRDKQNANDNEIARLAELIGKLQAENEDLQTGIDNGQAWLNNEENQPIENTATLEQELAEIREKNKQIEANNLAKEQDKKIEAAKAAADDADKEVKRIEAEKLDVIKHANMPAGFGFSEEGITYNGFPFSKDSLSSSAIYIGALKLAAATLGEVKTLHFDASYLDKNSLFEIEKWAHENGLQLLIERPDFEGGDIEYQIIADANE